MPRFCPTLILIFSAWTTAAVAATGYACAQDQTREQEKGRPKLEFPYKGGTIVLTSDEIHKPGLRYEATGNVRITYEDMVITCDKVEYDAASHDGATSGPTKFTQGKTWLSCSHAEFNFEKQTATFYDASGYTDQEFLVQGKTVLKTGHDTYSVENGSLTSCQEPNPKWTFRIGSGSVRINKTARLHSVVFRLKGIPVFYFPYLIVPMEEKKRSAGFLPFHIGSSSTKGREFTLGYYQPLGQSTDMTVYGDYFSKRGIGLGGMFRAKPNATTDLNIQAFGVFDRLNQGGAHLLVDGNTQFENGFRAAAKVNITTDFAFRQVFSEGFRSATIPEEQALVFATRTVDSFSTNFSFERTEVFFPERSLVIRKSPSIEFASYGKRLGKLPLILSFRAAADGMFRSDSAIQTPTVVERLDIFPRLTLKVPSLAGFSLSPSVGIRETYYGARLSSDAQPVVKPVPLRREYSDIEVDLRTPGLEREFHWDGLGYFRHLIEPVISYHRIHGISDAAEIIRFDDQDAIADTNEVTYGIVNRLMRRRETMPGGSQDYEFLALAVTQKYYFDPSFGGAFIPGELNQFYPLNTLTGFSATGIERNLSPITMDLRFTPKPGISFDLRADYDPKLGRLRNASLWTVWRHSNLLIAGTYVKTNALEPSMFAAHNLQTQIAYKSPEQRGWSGSMTMSYDFQTQKLLASTARLNYLWNCCGVAVEYQQYSLDLRRENRVTFSFSLKGIGHFGNLRRPDSLF